MVITGGLTAAAGASAKTELCATPSPGPATALQATADGAARTAVNRVPTGMTVTRDVSARTERPATTSPGNAVVHRDTLGPCKLIGDEPWSSTIDTVCLNFYYSLSSHCWV